VSFFWKNPNSGHGKQLGFIAQEVEAVLPSLTHNTGLMTPDTPDGMWHLDYNGLFAPIVISIQELAALTFEAQAKLAALKADNEDLRRALAQQEHRQEEQALEIFAVKEEERKSRREPKFRYTRHGSSDQ
jgi:hypothetical protein